MQRVIDIYQNLALALDNNDAVQRVGDIRDRRLAIYAIGFVMYRLGYIAEAQALEIFLRPAEPEVRIEDTFVAPDLFQAWGVQVVFVSMRQSDDVYLLHRDSFHRLGKDIPLAAICRAVKPRVGRDLYLSGVNQQAGVTYIFYFHVIPS